MDIDVTEKMERAFAELPTVRRGPFFSRLHDSYSREHFLRSMTHSNILFALHRAREAQELAVSYRDFKVGAAVVALTSRGAGFQVLPGINAKPDEESALNMHAEQLALRTTRAVKADMVSIVAVVGETQNDQQSGHEMHTLHPCGKCRTKLSEDPLIDNDATLIFSALPDLRTIEVGTVNTLKAYHDDTNPDPSGVTLFELPDLELLKPFDPSTLEDEVVRLEDSNRAIEEDRLWSESIGRYALNHRLSFEYLLNQAELES